MKRNRMLMLLLLVVLCIPNQIKADNLDVGVKVKGSVTIDVVTTLSADITIDVSKQVTYPAYVYLYNHSSVPVEAKITDIDATTPDAPSTFVGLDDYLGNSGPTDTKTKIGFRITDYENTRPAQEDSPSYEWQAIMPDSEISLGYLEGSAGIGSYADGLPYLLNTHSKDYTDLLGLYLKNNRLYQLDVNNGYAWLEDNKEFKYSITTVFEAADIPVDTQSVSEDIDKVHFALGVPHTDEGGINSLDTVYLETQLLLKDKNTKVTEISYDLYNAASIGNAFDNGMGGTTVSKYYTIPPEAKTYQPYQGPYDDLTLSDGLSYYVASDELEGFFDEKTSHFIHYAAVKNVNTDVTDSEYVYYTVEARITLNNGKTVFVSDIVSIAKPTA